jgi:hypothetical protein
VGDQVKMSKRQLSSGEIWPVNLDLKSQATVRLSHECGYYQWEKYKEILKFWGILLHKGWAYQD